MLFAWWDPSQMMIGLSFLLQIIRDHVNDIVMSWTFSIQRLILKIDCSFVYAEQGQ